MHWGYAPPICVIDNTNLARWYGLGADAVMVPEMATFAGAYGFRFLCHAPKHSDRKAGEERNFLTVETNFETDALQSQRAIAAALRAPHF